MTQVNYAKLFQACNYFEEKKAFISTGIFLQPPHIFNWSPESILR